MTGEAFLQACIVIAFALIVAAFAIVAYRIVVGPTLPDRIVGLDMLAAVGIGFIALIALKTGYYLYIDIAIALGLVAFLSTVALARFVLYRDEPVEDRVPQDSLGGGER